MPDFRSYIVGTVAIIVKVVGKKATHVEVTARAVADIAKCVSIVGAVVRLNHVFNVKETAFRGLGKIEEQLMRSWVKQMWRANMVADTEAKVDGMREAAKEEHFADVRLVGSEFGGVHEVVCGTFPACLR